MMKNHKPKSVALALAALSVITASTWAQAHGRVHGGVVVVPAPVVVAPVYPAPVYPVPAYPVYGYTAVHASVHCSTSDQKNTVDVLDQTLNELAVDQLRDEPGFVATVEKFNHAPTFSDKLDVVYQPMHLNASNFMQFIGATDLSPYISLLESDPSLAMSHEHAELAAKTIQKKLLESINN